MEQSKIRNVAIIAHVDHGKTTLVDQLFKYSGAFRDNQQVSERLMDSMDLERERGITITAKNGSYRYQGVLINIIDTPGHADFGGQVERVLRMADGALLLVDAQEGPMPQTYFVLKKALENNLPVIVVINKIDKPAARCDWVVDQVFDLFVKLNAPDATLDFPIVYTSAKNGYSLLDPEDPIVDGGNMEAISRMIVDHTPAPVGSPEEPLQMQVGTIDYSPYLGRLGIGKVVNGNMQINQPIVVARRDGSIKPVRISKIYRFESDEKVAVEQAGVGQIVAIAGMEDVTVGVTFTDPDNPKPLPLLTIDPPTISMNFIPNDSPFAGREGKYVTSRHLGDRLQREILADVALHSEVLTEGVGFKVSGRGELHLSILIEKMRREGYEFQVTRPQVIMKQEGFTATMRASAGSLRYFKTSDARSSELSASAVPARSEIALSVPLSRGIGCGDENCARLVLHCHGRFGVVAPVQFQDDHLGSEFQADLTFADLQNGAIVNRIATPKQNLRAIGLFNQRNRSIGIVGDDAAGKAVGISLGHC